MSVTFCFAKPFSERIETLAVSHGSPLQLNEVGYLNYLSYSPEDLRNRMKGSTELSNRDDIWRYRIICVLAPMEDVFCINFISSELRQEQVFHVMRMKNLEEDGGLYPVYWHDFSSYKFILPKEHLDRVFDLSK